MTRNSKTKTKNLRSTGSRQETMESVLLSVRLLLCKCFSSCYVFHHITTLRGWYNGVIWYSKMHITRDVLSECRGNTSVVGPATEHGWHHPRVLRLSGSAERPGGCRGDTHSRLRTGAAGVCARVLRTSSTVSGAEHKPAAGACRLHDQAGHHLPHCCTQREGLWTSHSSPVATG